MSGYFFLKSFLEYDGIIFIYLISVNARLLESKGK